MSINKKNQWRGSHNEMLTSEMDLLPSLIHTKQDGRPPCPLSLRVILDSPRVPQGPRKLTQRDLHGGRVQLRHYTPRGGGPRTPLLHAGAPSRGCVSRTMMTDICDATLHTGHSCRLPSIVLLMPLPLGVGCGLIGCNLLCRSTFLKFQSELWCWQTSS